MALVNFYRGLREPTDLLNFARQKRMSEFRFYLYANCGNDILPENVVGKGRVDRDAFRMVVSHSSAAIVIGNKTSVKYRSSKFYEYLSCRVPIIGIGNDEEMSYYAKYPFFLDSQDNELVQKLEHFQQKDLLSFNPYKIFPERDPEKIMSDVLAKVTSEPNT